MCWTSLSPDAQDVKRYLDVHRRKRVSLQTAVTSPRGTGFLTCLESCFSLCIYNCFFLAPSLMLQLKQRPFCEHQFCPSPQLSIVFFSSGHQLEIFNSNVQTQMSSEEGLFSFSALALHPDNGFCQKGSFVRVGRGVPLETRNLRSLVALSRNWP